MACAVAPLWVSGDADASSEEMTSEPQAEEELIMFPLNNVVLAMDVATDI